MGLGLSVVYGIIDRHKGAIVAESEALTAPFRAVIDRSASSTNGGTFARSVSERRIRSAESRTTEMVSTSSTAMGELTPHAASAIV